MLKQMTAAMLGIAIVAGSAPALAATSTATPKNEAKLAKAIGRQVMTAISSF